MDSIDVSISATDPAGFRKSSYCEANGSCVEVAEYRGWIVVGDSKCPSCPVLWFTPDEWEVFVAGVLAGESAFGRKFDRVKRLVGLLFRLFA